MRIKYLPLPKGFKLTPNHDPLYTEAQMKAYVRVHIKQLIEKKESNEPMALPNQLQQQ